LILRILFILFIAAPCYGQFTDSTARLLSLSATGSANTTNDSKAYLLNNTLRFGIQKKPVNLNLSAKWIYGKQNGLLSNNDFSTIFDANFYTGWQRFYYWGLANYNTSESLNINNQLLTGAGIAYSFIDTEKTYLNLSNGLLYDTSDLMLSDSIRDQYETVRNSLRLSFRFVIAKRFTLGSTSFLQQSLVNGRDYIIRSDASFSVSVNRWLSLTSAFNYNRTSRTARENTLLSYGITFERYF